MRRTAYSGLSGTIIVDTVFHDEDVVVRADTEIFHKILQTSSAIALHRVTRIVDRFGNYMAEDSPRNVEVDAATWSCRGEIEILAFANGVASLTLNTYGPGDKWTAVWLIHCNRVDVEHTILRAEPCKRLSDGSRISGCSGQRLSSAPSFCSRASSKKTDMQ